MNDIYKAAGILIKNKKILVTRTEGKDFFIAPGGSIEEGETGEKALIRELKEELCIDTDESGLEEFGEFSAPAAGQEHRIVHMRVWFVKKWQGEPIASSEVEEMKWVASDNPENLQIGSIFLHDVMPKLNKMGLIN